MLTTFNHFLHIAPLFAIATLMLSETLYNKKTGKGIDLSAIILMLSSIGISAGFGIHHHSAESMYSCYSCFGYSFFLIVLALKNMGQKLTTVSSIKSI